MNALASAIQSLGLAGTPAEIVAALSASVETATPNPTRYSYQGVAAALGTAVSGTILMLLEQAASDTELPPVLRANLRAELASFQVGSADGRTGGLDLSHPDRQTQMATWIETLTALGQTDAAQAVAAVRQLGVARSVAPRWELTGLDSLPTEEQVAAAQSQIAVAQWVAALQNEVIGPMSSTGESTVDQIKAAVAAFRDQP